MKTKTSIRTFIARLAMTLVLALLTATAAFAQQTPSASYDVCEGHQGFVLVQGWAYDPDVPAASIDVRIDVYTNSTCTALYKSETLTANRHRGDVNNSHNITGSHGVSKNIYIDDAGTYWVRFTALDATGDADNMRPAKQATVTAFNVLASDDPVTDPVTLTAGTYKVLSDVTYNKRITVSGNVTLFLGEGTTLTAKAGISVHSGNKLTIEGNGSLVANGGRYEAGIGGGNINACGEVVINNGHITATGGEEAAGIGSGSNCEDGRLDNTGCKITINGGVVYAKGDRGSAAIGGSLAWDNYSYYFENNGDYDAVDDTDGMPGTIVINGGQVTAVAGNEAAYAIGRGQWATGTVGGSLRLGWTDPTDFICATAFDPNNMTIADGKDFVIGNTGVDATVQNIAGQHGITLRPKARGMEQATVSGLLSAYTYRNEAFMPTYTVTDAFGNVLTPGTDFTAALTCGDEAATALNAVGSYTLTLTGTGQYAGTLALPIEVKDILPPPYKIVS